MPSADAIFEDGAGRPTLRFERLLAHPPERVWKALTEPDEQATWHPSPFDMEPAVGGAVSYREGDAWPTMAEGRVTELDPPRLLGHTWGDDDLRWELRPHDGGCLLILTHSFDDRFKAARDGAGWHVCLDALASSLDGVPNPPGGDPEAPGPWHALNAHYQERFGISPEQATPPPRR
jgi:uncharacterized protein YndB with AHSA1/START domain